MLKKINGKVVSVVAGAVSMVVVGSANAALPTVIGTELATVQTDGLALADLMWPFIMAIFGALLLMKLFKRFGSKI